MNGVPLNIDWQQILLHLFNFVILFAILYLLLYKPIKNFIEKRKQAYKDMDDEATSNLEESKKLKEEYDLKLAGADEEIKAKEDEILKEAGQKAELKIVHAEEEAALIIKNANEQAQKEKEKIVSKANEEITNIAKEAAAKAIFGSTSDAYDTFLDQTEEK